ncbi:MAG: methionine--tRNA ligase subunit beta, partial [Ginsengibacter sp.]
DEYLRDFPGQQDVLRYVLCANAPETKDNDFTWKDFQDRCNSELVAIFGNFVNRTFVLMHKLCNGKVPVLHSEILDDADKKMIEELALTKSKIETLLEQYKFRDALFEVIDLARKGNKYMQDKQPWIVAKQTTDDGQLTTEGQNQIDNCLHICLQLCANLAIFINPFLPFTAKKMIHMMKVLDKMLDWENAGKSKLLSVGYSLRAPELLFRKIEDAEVAAQIEKLNKGLADSNQSSVISDKQSVVSNHPKTEGEKQKTKSNVQPASSTTEENKSEISKIKPEIVFDDFAKIDLKVGTIISAEKVEKADKLLKLEIDLGFEKRIILSGIAQHFSPEEITGKQVVVVANLAPRKMRGIESNGMILMAEDEEGKLHFVKPGNVIGNGSGVS